MDFIKLFEVKKRGYKNNVGSAIIMNGTLRIRLPNTVSVVDRGYIEGGIGCVTEPCVPRKSPYNIYKVDLDTNLIPPELRGREYKFYIPAKQISENEFVFLYKDAKMMNKK